MLLLSRKHARLTVVDGQLLLSDLSTGNGTYVNNHKLLPSRPHALHENDMISFGGPHPLKCKDRQMPNPWTFRVKYIHVFLANYHGNARETIVSMPSSSAEPSTRAPREVFTFTDRPRLSDVDFSAETDDSPMRILPSPSLNRVVGEPSDRANDFVEDETNELFGSIEDGNEPRQIEIVDLTEVEDSPKARKVRKCLHHCFGIDVNDSTVSIGEENPSPDRLDGIEIPVGTSPKTSQYGSEHEQAKVVATVVDAFRQNYTCAICQELMVGAYAFIPCGHLYCGGCISNWLERRTECPTCRAKTSAPCTRQVTVDNIIEANLALLDNEEKRIREEKVVHWERHRKLIERKLLSRSSTFDVRRGVRIVDRPEDRSVDFGRAFDFARR